jgi:hypothetical protein
LGWRDSSARPPLRRGGIAAGRADQPGRRALLVVEQRLQQVFRA